MTRGEKMICELRDFALMLVPRRMQIRRNCIVKRERERESSPLAPSIFRATLFIYLFVAGPGEDSVNVRESLANGLL